MEKNREIERKFTTEESDLHVLSSWMSFNLKPRDVFSGKSTDTFWTSPCSSKCDFIRLRKFENGNFELTCKTKDRGNNINRKEINLHLDGHYNNKDIVFDFLCDILGYPPVGTITKEYYVFFLDHGNVSIYSIEGYKRTFVEIEGMSIESVDDITKRVKELIFLRPEDRSIFEIFFGKRVANERAY